MAELDVAIVIPAYNAADTLGEQIEALAAQETDLAVEILVCDNGSTDATREVVRSWQVRVPGLRLIDASARRGPSSARNAGARASTAPLIVFCDADDVVGTGWLEAMCAGLQKAALCAGVLEGDALNDGHRGSLSWVPDGVYRKPFLPLLAVSSNNLGIRRDVFESLGGFEQSLPTNEDTDLSWRVQLSGHALIQQPDAIVHIRKRSGLRAVYKQAYSYGAGDKLLRHRYTRVIAAYNAASPGRAVEMRPTAFDTQNIVRRALNKITRIRRPADVADQVWRVGFWLGDRLGPEDTTIAQVEPPENLPGAGDATS